MTTHSSKVLVDPPTSTSSLWSIKGYVNLQWFVPVSKKASEVYSQNWQFRVYPASWTPTSRNTWTAWVKSTTAALAVLWWAQRLLLTQLLNEATQMSTTSPCCAKHAHQKHPGDAPLQNKPCMKIQYHILQRITTKYHHRAILHSHVDVYQLLCIFKSF